MNKKRNRLIIFILIITATVALFKFYTNNRYVKMPSSDNISRFEILHIVNDELVNKETISESQDINEFLNILKNAKKADIENISTYSNDRPDRDNYIIINTKLSKGEGYTTNYIYKSNSYFYFEQPFYGLFKIDPNNLEESNYIKRFLN